MESTSSSKRLLAEGSSDMHVVLHLLLRHGRLDRVKRPRRPRRQAVRKHAERGVGVPAVPAWHPSAGGGLPRVGAVAAEGAAAGGMVRADIQSGVAPGFRANVFLGGKLRFVSDLQLPVHGPAKCNSRGPPPSSFAGSTYRPDAAWKGPAGKISLERISAGKGDRQKPGSGFPRCPGNPAIRARNNPGRNLSPGSD